jgi:hypothetical protein
VAITPLIAVHGGAADDSAFSGNGSLVRYVVSTGSAARAFRVEAELWYQQIGFRWVHNLEPYKAAEPQRMMDCYEQASEKSATVRRQRRVTSVRARRASLAVRARSQSHSVATRVDRHGSGDTGTTSRPHR